MTVLPVQSFGIRSLLSSATVTDIDIDFDFDGKINYCNICYASNKI